MSVCGPHYADLSDIGDTYFKVSKLYDKLSASTSGDGATR